MIYVGIDVAKDKHDCVIMDQTGEVLRSVFTIANTNEGYESLLQTIRTIEKDPNNVKVGLESTGHFCYNLIGFLTLQCHFSVYILNPLRVKQYHSCLSLRKTKTDRIDASVIARMLISDRSLQPYTLQSYHRMELKSLTRYRFTRIQARSKLKTSVMRLVNILFPELESLFSTIHGACVQTLLTTYPSAEAIANAPIADLTDLLQKASKGHYPEEMATQLQDLAKHSIGMTSPAKSLELCHTIRLIRELDAEVKDIELAIKQIMDTLETPILSIPGISYNTGAVIIAEIGDFSNFSSPDKILAFAGLSPTIYQSGQYNGNNHAKMEKRGSIYLRYALYNAAKFVCNYEQSFCLYLAKKRSEGKHYNVAISHASKRLVRLIYAMEKSGQQYHS